MTKLLARRAYQGRHRACATPGCPIVARHHVNICSPTTAVELVADGAR